MNTDFALIYNKFEIDRSPFSKENHSPEQLRERLAHAIARLIQTDMERLLWILYRLDVSEEKAITALSLSEMPDFALADLVIERELQKIKTRQQYKEWQENHPHSDVAEDVEGW